MENEFKIGDKVRLKSGSPVMTVVKYTPIEGPSPANTTCNWFSQNVNGEWGPEPHWGGFPALALHRAEA